MFIAAAAGYSEAKSCPADCQRQTASPLNLAPCPGPPVRRINRLCPDQNLALNGSSRPCASATYFSFSSKARFDSVRRRPELVGAGGCPVMPSSALRRLIWASSSLRVRARMIVNSTFQKFQIIRVRCFRPDTFIPRAAISSIASTIRVSPEMKFSRCSIVRE